VGLRSFGGCLLGLLGSKSGFGLGQKVQLPFAVEWVCVR
jgi:hypothetical protein